MKCTECDKDLYAARCICADPVYVMIEPGNHKHLQCPRHGDVKIFGPRRWFQFPPDDAEVTSRWFTKFGKPSKSMRLTESFGPG